MNEIVRVNTKQSKSGLIKYEYKWEGGTKNKKFGVNNPMSPPNPLTQECLYANVFVGMYACMSVCVCQRDIACVCEKDYVCVYGCERDCMHEIEVKFNNELHAHSYILIFLNMYIYIFRHLKYDCILSQYERNYVCFFVWVIMYV